MLARSVRSRGARAQRRGQQSRSYSDNKSVQQKAQTTPNVHSGNHYVDPNFQHVLGAIQSHKPSAWGKLVTGIGKAIFPAPKDSPSELFNYEAKPTEAEVALYADFAKLQQQQRAPVIELANLRVEAKNAERAELVKSLATKLNKSVDQVSEVDVAAELLQRREEFINSINLETTVLFSARYRLDILKKEAEAIKKFNPSKEALALLEKELKKVEDEAANEMIVPMEVDADVFEGVKANLFPSYKGLPATHYLAMLGGTTKAQRPEEKDLFFNDAHAWNVNDPFLALSESEKQAAVGAVSTLLSADQPSANEVVADVKASVGGGKFAADAETGLNSLRNSLNSSTKATFVIDTDKLKTQLAQQQSSLGLSDLQVAYALHHAAETKALITSNSRDAVSQIFALGRETKEGDVRPELRLAGLVPSSHFLLDHNSSLHIAGSFNGLPADATKGPLDKVSFSTREFTAPTSMRQPDHPFTDVPAYRKNFQKVAVDFPTFESSATEHPNNPRELVVDMKVWKLFNYIFPNLKTPESRLAFMEHYDISPGERTLEWTQSWPPPEHTFVEAPIIKEAEEPSEDGKQLPVAWPKYNGPNITFNTAKLAVEEDHHHHTDVVVVTDIKPSAKLASPALQIPK